MIDNKYIIYHIPGKKIGVTNDLYNRVECQQGYEVGEYEILESSDDIKYISKINSLYGNSKTDEYGNPETATTRIQEQDRQKKAKPKKIVEKPRPKPTYLNGNVIDLMPFLPDEEWWKIFEEEPPKEKFLLRVPRRKLKGLASLLNVG